MVMRCKYATQGELSPNADERFPNAEYCNVCSYCYCCNSHKECSGVKWDIDGYVTNVIWDSRIRKQ